MQFSDGDFAD
jgi:hypothetical protein